MKLCFDTIIRLWGVTTFGHMPDPYFLTFAKQGGTNGTRKKARHVSNKE